jgi:hypothetical protein
MSQHEDTSNLSKEELEFNDCIKRGDDFMTIQIYRSAKEWYTKAVEMKFNDELAKDKLDICNKKLKTESHTIIAVVVIAALIVGSLFLFRVI